MSDSKSADPAQGHTQAPPVMTPPEYQYAAAPTPQKDTACIDACVVGMCCCCVIDASICDPTECLNCCTTICLSCCS